MGFMQGLTDDWRVRLAFPIFQLIDFLLSRQRVARFLFDNFRTKDNLKKVLQVTTSAAKPYSHRGHWMVAIVTRSSTSFADNTRPDFPGEESHDADLSMCCCRRAACIHQPRRSG